MRTAISLQQDKILFICSSWRTRGATSASEAQQSRRAIKVLGRWRSNALERYTTISPLELKKAGEAMALQSSSTHNLTSSICSWGKGKHPLGGV
jgi:hypothetical protein